MTNGRRTTVLLVTHLYHSGKYEELERVAGTLNGCSSCSLARSDNGWHFGVLEMLGTEAADTARSILSESQEWGLSGQYLGERQSDEPSGRVSDSHQPTPVEQEAPERKTEPKVERRLSAESAHRVDEGAREGNAAAASPPAVPETTAIAAAKLGLMDSLGNEAALVQKVKNVTFEMLAEHFESGLKEAAASLGLSPTSLKRACRKLGIRKWPRRELKRRADAECAQLQPADRSPPPADQAGQLPSAAAAAHMPGSFQQPQFQRYSDQQMITHSHDADTGYDGPQPEDQHPAKVFIQAAAHQHAMQHGSPAASPSPLGREAPKSPFRAWMHTGKWGTLSDAAGSAAVPHKMREAHGVNPASPGPPGFRPPPPSQRSVEPPSAVPTSKTFSTDAAVQRILESRADASRELAELHQRGGQAYLHRCVPIVHISRPLLQPPRPAPDPLAIPEAPARSQPAPSDSETISETSSGHSDPQPSQQDAYQGHASS